MNVKKILKEFISSEKKIDFYVPIITKYKENENKDKYMHESLFNYSLFNKKDSFIEILIDTKTKKIVNINLISINDINKNIELEINLEEIPFIFGNPIININIFEKNPILIEKKDFNIVINNKKIYLLLNFKSTAKRIIMGDVEILLDNKNNIVGYIFMNFSNIEWYKINEILESKNIR